MYSSWAPLADSRHRGHVGPPSPLSLTGILYNEDFPVTGVTLMVWETPPEPLVSSRPPSALSGLFHSLQFWASERSLTNHSPKQSSRQGQPLKTVT